MGYQAEEHKPEVISRQGFTEGGFTFLKRALRTAIAEASSTVVINSGGLLITYSPNIPGEQDQTFMDGVRSVEGDQPASLEAFKSVAEQYLVQMGLAELAEEAK